MIRILHVDDEPDIREVVEISLSLDPGFTTRSCGSGEEALVVAIDWQPDIILCDVMMPVMDGPATLMRLRENALTADIPVVFMTARAQTRELDGFRSLGAFGVIPKPFDPMTLAASVRSYVRPAHDPLDDLRAGFRLRVNKDAAALSEYRLVLKDETRPPDVLDRNQACRAQPFGSRRNLWLCRNQRRRGHARRRNHRRACRSRSWRRHRSCARWFDFPCREQRGLNRPDGAVASGSTAARRRSPLH